MLRMLRAEKFNGSPKKAHIIDNYIKSRSLILDILNAGFLDFLISSVLEQLLEKFPYGFFVENRRRRRHRRIRKSRILGIVLTSLPPYTEHRPSPLSIPNP